MVNSTSAGFVSSNISVSSGLATTPVLVVVKTVPSIVIVAAAPLGLVLGEAETLDDGEGEELGDDETEALGEDDGL